MKVKTRGILLIVLAALGVIWNLLCLTGLFPLEKWGFSLTFMGIAGLINIIPLFIPFNRKADEKSEHISGLNKKDKIFAGLSIVFIVAWAITAAACLVYPL